MEFSPRLSPTQFYSQVRARLDGLGVEGSETGELIRAAVFEENGWAGSPATAGDRLLGKVRELVADRWGGRLPARLEIEGVSIIGGQARIGRW